MCPQANLAVLREFAHGNNSLVSVPGTKFILAHSPPGLHVRLIAIATESPAPWSQKMQEYCAYIIGPDGHILNRIDLICANEDEAKECALRLVDGENVELWQRDRKLAEFRKRH
jgi:hypothetical protein